MLECRPIGARRVVGDPLNNNPGYTYSSLGDARVDRAITANDLVDANGACPNYAPQSASPGAGEGASPQDGAALFGGGVALGMSECDIVLDWDKRLP